MVKQKLKDIFTTEMRASNFSINFIIRSKKLQTTANMRSNQRKFSGHPAQE